MLPFTGAYLAYRGRPELSSFSRACWGKGPLHAKMVVYGVLRMRYWVSKKQHFQSTLLRRRGRMLMFIYRAFWEFEMYTRRTSREEYRGFKSNNQVFRERQGCGNMDEGNQEGYLENTQ